LVSKNPLVGPLPFVLGLVSGFPSPSTSWENPVRITSPTKIPLLRSVSVSLYGLREYFPVDIFTKCSSSPPMESIADFFAFQLGATIVITTLSVQVYTGLSVKIGEYGLS
jgi:hypothetical protein